MATTETAKVTKRGKNGATTVMPVGMQIVSPASNVVDLPIGQIVADSDFNVRQTVDPEEVALLAKSIKNEGLLQPVTVAPRGDGKYDLIAGFQRFYAHSWAKERGGLADDAAYQKSTKGTIRATIQTEGIDRLGLLYTNLVENEARHDLSPYDIAKRCLLIQTEFPDQKGPQIAARIGKHPTYVNDLLLVLKTAIPAVVDQWKNENDPAYRKAHNLGKKKVLPTDKIKLIAKLPPTQQQEELDKAMGKIPTTAPVVLGADGKPVTPPPVADKGSVADKVASKSLINRAIVALKSKGASNAKEAALKEAMVHALRWCLHSRTPDGKLKGIVGGVSSKEIEEAKEDADK